MLASNILGEILKFVLDRVGTPLEYLCHLTAHVTLSVSSQFCHICLPLVSYDSQRIDGRPSPWRQEMVMSHLLRLFCFCLDNVFRQHIPAYDVQTERTRSSTAARQNKPSLLNYANGRSVAWFDDVPAGTFPAR
jgi:hypothetical protein